jgi:hypothetical protein
MPLTTTEKNAVLDFLAGRLLYASGHSADPAGTGANEFAGGGYSRQAATWNAAAAGNLDLDGTITITVPAGQALHSIGFWSASSGGTFRGSKALAAPIADPVGTYTITDFDWDIP